MAGLAPMGRQKNGEWLPARSLSGDALNRDRSCLCCRPALWQIFLLLLCPSVGRSCFVLGCLRFFTRIASVHAHYTAKLARLNASRPSGSRIAYDFLGLA